MWTINDNKKYIMPAYVFLWFLNTISVTYEEIYIKFSGILIQLKNVIDIYKKKKLNKKEYFKCL